MKPLFRASLVLCALAWGVHLVTGTAALRGFFGDGALVFLMHLSTSYMFGQGGHFVHLFAVGFPREAQFALNALALQLLLGLGVTDPALFKYAFVFWQFALPGLLYLLLFWGLWRAGKVSWAVFPLLSWAVLSVPVDWNAVNSTRWALPIFWMHFFIMLLAGPRIRLWPLTGAIILGLLMWGGLYESVMLQCGLCIGLGAVIWWREKNRTPFLYALVTIPGAIRSFLFYITNGHSTPNSFHGLLLPHRLSEPYFLLILLPLTFALVIALAPRFIAAARQKQLIIALAAILILAAVITITGDLPSVWDEGEVKFDYVFLSLGLMAWAGAWRVLKKTPADFALPAAAMALLTGAVLWSLQSMQTADYKACRADYMTQRGDRPLAVGLQLQPLLAASDNIHYIDWRPFGPCLWDWTEPWASLLTAPDGRVDQWPLYTFWQDFSFAEKDNAPVLHTNNWALTSPSVYVSAADLPLKTPLHDVTPLYDRLGQGEFVTRLRCLPPEFSGSYWRDHLLGLDDDKRRSMYVCPRQPPELP